MLGKKLKDRTDEELMEEGKKARAGGVTTAFVCAVDLVYIGVGAVLEFVNGFSTTYLAYLLCGVLLFFGILFIVKYFIRENYHDANNYGFSIGTFMVVLGALGLTRLTFLSEHIIPFLGVCALVSSITVLQNTIQLKALRSRIWWLMGILSVISILGSAVMIVDVFDLAKRIPDYSYWALMCVGALSLLASLIVLIQTKFYGKRLIKDAQKAREEAKTPVFIPQEEAPAERYEKTQQAEPAAEASTAQVYQTTDDAAQSGFEAAKQSLQEEDTTK